MEIHVWRKNGKRHYTSFCKVKIMIIRPAMKSSDRAINFYFYLRYNDAHPSLLLASSLFSLYNQDYKKNKEWNNTAPVLSWNGIFMKTEFNFINRFEAKMWKVFRDFERDEYIKRQNNEIETKIREANRTFRLLKFLQAFISDGGIVASSKHVKHDKCMYRK